MPDDPWPVIRQMSDRGRYTRVLTSDGAHALAGAPATMIRTSTHYPDPAQVRHYLEHSCDITMRGGAASTVAYPLAVCALAEHYLLRRLGGASGGAATAAAAAAAELGRAAPDPAQTLPPFAVVPGFAGLAQLTGWLAGPEPDEHSEPDEHGEPESWRLTRLFQPAGAGSAPFRLLATVLRWPHLTRAQRLRAPVAAVVGALGRQSKAVMVLVWTGFAVGGLGMVVSQLRAARATPGASVTLAAVTGLALAVALLMAAVLASILVYALGMIQLLRAQAEPNYFGLVSGIRRRRPPGTLRARVGAALDRWSGIPEAGDVPPIGEWLADRIDDLAGIDLAGIDPGKDARHALTFGDLWLGRLRDPRADDVEQLSAMALDREQRVVDLTLVATNLSQRRPYRLPFPAPGLAGRTGGVRYLFCASCLRDVLPGRVVAQMVRDCPAVEAEHTCPRHSHGIGPRHTSARDIRLRELPDPWDLPVAFAVRMSMATPGLLRAVPLYSIESSPLAEPGSVVAPDRVVVRTHWFCDGGVTSNVPITFFDTLLPRWPTFGLTVSPMPDDAEDEWVHLPPQDASTHRPTWRAIGSPSSFVSALVGAGLDWRDTLQADLPGFRGRVASVRHGLDESANPLFLTRSEVANLALRGYHAGVGLRERFTGPDLDSPDTAQTQTDRHRWIRMRMAVREVRRMSMDLGARMPLYGDLASTYRVPQELTGWFDPPLAPGELDRAWADTATAVTTLRALSTGGVLDFDADDGAPPLRSELGINPPE